MQAHGFRVSFTPLLAVLFTFPSRYSSTIGLTVVLSLGGWCRLFRTGFLRPRPTRGSDQVGKRFAYGALTLCGPPSHAGSAALASSLSVRPSTPGAPRRPRFGLAPFRSPLLGGSLLFSFPPPTWMFRFGGFAPAKKRVPRLQRGGFPHSGTPGSQAARASPGNIAACRALRRLREPQASPVRPSPLARRAPHRCGKRAARARLSCVSLFSLRIHSTCLASCQRTAPLAAGTDCLLPPAGLVEDVGLEPTTPGLQSRCSSRLSQSPPQRVVPGRLELPTPTLSVWCSNRLSYGTPA